MHASSAPDEPGRGIGPGVTWEPFGITPETWDNVEERDGIKWLHLSSGSPGDRSATWLKAATLALGILAAAAAAVSFEAQFRMVYAAKGVTWAAALEAGIPDAAALVFAALGIALALHGKRAVRPRVLNVGAVLTSVTMNALAAGPGWRDWAIWIMPPVAYALASDTLIGVVRAHAIAQQRESGDALADDDATPLAVLTGVCLWVLRLVLAPASTLSGFRGWVLDECPVAPGRRAAIEPPAAAITLPIEYTACPECRSTVVLPDGSCAGCGRDGDDEPDEPSPPDRQHRDGSKTSRFLQLVEEQHGPLAAIDPSKVSRISSELAPLVDLHPGSARSVLGKRVRATQNGHSS